MIPSLLRWRATIYSCISPRLHLCKWLPLTKPSTHQAQHWKTNICLDCSLAWCTGHLLSWAKSERLHSLRSVWFILIFSWGWQYAAELIGDPSDAFSQAWFIIVTVFQILELCFSVCGWQNYVIEQNLGFCWITGICSFSKTFLYILLYYSF